MVSSHVGCFWVIEANWGWMNQSCRDPGQKFSKGQQKKRPVQIVSFRSKSGKNKWARQECKGQGQGWMGWLGWHWLRAHTYQKAHLVRPNSEPSLPVAVVAPSTQLSIRWQGGCIAPGMSLNFWGETKETIWDTQGLLTPRHWNG